VARALYDNIAESPDELAFRKGDVLTVLEQNTGGIEGWWLCSLRGRQVRLHTVHLPLFSSSKFFSSCSTLYLSHVLFIRLVLVLFFSVLSCPVVFCLSLFLASSYYSFLYITTTILGSGNETYRWA
jgi:hypothetical protein